jgi:hypothetical protein
VEVHVDSGRDFERVAVENLTMDYLPEDSIAAFEFGEPVTRLGCSDAACMEDANNLIPVVPMTRPGREIDNTRW